MAERRRRRAPSARPAIKSSRKVQMPINGVEVRALEAAADYLESERDMAAHRRKRVAGQLLRLHARWRLRDRVT